MHSRGHSVVCARLLSHAFHAPSSVLRERSILRRQALFLAGCASSLRPLPFVVSARLASLREGAFQFSSEWLLSSKLATVRQGTQGVRPVPLCRLTLQSRGQTPASRCSPLISNVERLHAVLTLAHASQRCIVHRACRSLWLRSRCPSSLVSQWVSRRGRPARSAPCRQRFSR